MVYITNPYKPQAQILQINQNNYMKELRIPRISTLFLVKIVVGIIISTIVLWLLASWYLVGQTASLIYQNQISWASVPPSSMLDYTITYEKNSKNQYFSIWEFDNPSSQDYILYLHGNAGRLLHFFSPLTQSYTVVSPAYNGFSESEGKPDEKLIYEVAEKTYDWMVNQGIPENRITILGHSMGGAVAVDLATKKPKAKQVVLINTFSSIQSMCVRSYGPLCVFTGGIFNSTSKAGEIKIPAYVFVYDGDTTIPSEESDLLYEKIASENKKLVKMEGFGHSYPDFDLIIRTIE